MCQTTILTATFSSQSPLKCVCLSSLLVAISPLSQIFLWLLLSSPPGLVKARFVIGYIPGLAAKVFGHSWLVDWPTFMFIIDENSILAENQPTITKFSAVWVSVNPQSWPVVASKQPFWTVRLRSFWLTGFVQKWGIRYTVYTLKSLGMAQTTINIQFIGLIYANSLPHIFCTSPCGNWNRDRKPTQTCRSYSLGN